MLMPCLVLSRRACCCQGARQHRSLCPETCAHAYQPMSTLPCARTLSGRLIAYAAPNSIDLRALNRPTSGAQLGNTKRMQNHRLAINSMSNIGCAFPELSPDKLDDAAKHKDVVGQVRQCEFNTTRSGAHAAMPCAVTGVVECDASRIAEDLHPCLPS